MVLSLKRKNENRALLFTVNFPSQFCLCIIFDLRLQVVPHFSLGMVERAKITPREKRRHAVGREKNEGLQTKPKLLNKCVALTTQNSDWLFNGNLSASVKNAPAAINTRHNHNYRTNNWGYSCRSN